MMRMASIRICLCYLLPLLFNEGVLVWGRGFEFLSFSDLVNNAAHLYGPPINTNTATDDLLHMNSGHILFPCMNFTCAGRITKLMFIAPTIDEISANDRDQLPTTQSPLLNVQWPQFSLWRGHDDCTGEECCMPRRQDGINIINLIGRRNKTYSNNGHYGIYEIDFSTNNYMFQSGDFLRVSYPSPCQTPCQRVNILYQNGGGYCPVRVAYYSSGQCVMESRGAILPYIAFKTADDNDFCAINFLTRQSLINIINASNSGDSLHVTINDPGQEFINSAPINRSGNVLKFLIAAKFNYSAASIWSASSDCQTPSGLANRSWPIIEIVRNTSWGITILLATCQEPRPSGYLNVFKYELSGDIQIGDVVRIAVPWPVSPETSKYLLAFLGPSQPMVHIEINDTTSNQDTTTSEFEAASHTEVQSTNKEQNIAVTTTKFIVGENTTESDQITPSTGSGPRLTETITGVVCTVVILVLLMFVLITALFVIHRHKNKASLSSTQPTYAEVNNRRPEVENNAIEMDVNQAYVTHDPQLEQNIAYHTHSLMSEKEKEEYDYVPL